METSKAVMPETQRQIMLHKNISDERRFKSNDKTIEIAMYGKAGEGSLVKIMH